MFYQSQVDTILRFGDVLNWGLYSNPFIDHDIHLTKSKDFSVKITYTDFSVVLTPCCSIENDKISLAPLKQVRSAFFDNEYFAEDLTRINCQVPPEKSVSKHVWENFNVFEIEKRMAVGNAYTFINIFIYDKEDSILPKYILNRKKGENINSINTYMIDFNDIITIKTDKLKSNTNFLLSFKRLQLSTKTREDLRNKIAHYFHRIPEEDNAQLLTKQIL